ncbi:MAG: phospholipase D-like domain-containing protein, partial [Candidatus Heimdallarchaeota archaeon]
AASNKVVLMSIFSTNGFTITISFLEAANRGIDVTLITRHPSSYWNYDKAIEEFHQKLSKGGINLIYDPTVHAKIIVADRAVAIISSMNFNPYSSAGKSWEAGLVTINPNVVESIQEGVIKLQDLI